MVLNILLGSIKVAKFLKFWYSFYFIIRILVHLIFSHFLYLFFMLKATKSKQEIFFKKKLRWKYICTLQSQREKLVQSINSWNKKIVQGCKESLVQVKACKRPNLLWAYPLTCLWTSHRLLSTWTVTSTSRDFIYVSIALCGKTMLWSPL